VLTPADALQKARDIVGRTRLVAGKLYLENPTEGHERLMNFLLDLLKDGYPELVEFVKRLRLWYG
jgi:hypothetical protein